MENPIPDVYIDIPEKDIRGWIKPMTGVEIPEKLNSQCCCLKDLIRAIETDSEPVLNAKHARHVLEIMCKIPKAIETEKAIELETAF